MPAMSVTMWRSSPMKALISDDLPALGRPTIANFGMSSSCSVSSSSTGRSLTISSRRSPVPEPLMPETGYGSPSPRE